LPIKVQKNKKMKKQTSVYIVILLTALACSCWSGCSKQFSQPVYPVAALNVVNALPTSSPLILVQGSITSEIGNFSNVSALPYGNTFVLTAMSGSETFYAVQSNADTTIAGGKNPASMFNGVLNFKAGGLYSLFITGADTTSPDFLFVQDTVPVIRDSSMGIRFVNLSTGSHPISINLEGSSNGSEVGNQSYKGITGFKEYINNSTTTDYLFVIRDASTGDSLTQFDFLASGSSNTGYGLTDPSNSQNYGTLLTFKHVTIAVYGSENFNTSYQMTTMLIDNY
jgi:hypothetical protein